jgi:hypothetical protein
MKVDQLIKILQQYPQNAIVRVLGLNEEDELVYEPITSSTNWKDSKTGIEYIDF